MDANLTIEDIILSNDQRGISELRDLVPSDSCARAAELVLDNAGTIYVAESTDVIDFPITTLTKSVQYAEEILSAENPSVLISIERCAAAADGLYRNMRDLDISDQTAKVDLMFDMHSKTIGIGDGGNEIGLGNVRDGVEKSETLVSYPAVSKVTELIIASVSNWGGYGLLAALSVSAGKNILPTIDEDGFSGEQICKVDGFDLAENAALLGTLHELVNGALTS